MTNRQKILIGGLGALTPVVMNLLVVDLSTLLLSLTLLAGLAYLIKVAVLFYLGGLVAYFHKEENSPLKLFELGIAAPALITAFLNAQRVEMPHMPSPSAEVPSAAPLFIGSAYAQPVSKQETKTFSLPQETTGEQLLRGFTGSISKRVWFVVAGSHLKLEDAEKQVQYIAKRWPGFKGDVYAPYGGNPYYAVVIGANLTYEEAQDLRRRAIIGGFPQDTYLWTFPRQGK